MIGVHVAEVLRRPALWANTGGPLSRTRSVSIESSVFGKRGGAIRCCSVLHLGLQFRRDPVKTMEDMLKMEGIAWCEDLRKRFTVPDCPLVCGPLPASYQRLSADKGDPNLILKQALLLGLCTAHLYDPARPVVWTGTSLSRGVALFDPAGFYA